MHGKMICLVCASLVLGAVAMAQMPDRAFILGGGPGGPAFQHGPGMVSMRLDSMDVAPVKGAPFCATVASEHTESLADGNRIHTNDTAQLSVATAKDGLKRSRPESFERRSGYCAS